MKKYLFKNIPVIMLTLLFTSQLNAQLYKKIFEITPFAGMEYFYWGEYADNSIQIVEEYGFLYRAGLTSKIKFSRNLDLYLLIEPTLYYGIENYNGFLHDAYGNSEPYKSESAYWGTASTLNFGYDFYASNKFVLSPEFGFKHEYWNRDIDNGGQYGYDEVYNVFIMDFGFNATFQFSYSSKIFLRLLGEYPLSIDESIDMASRGQGGPSDLQLEPNANIGINGEVGANIFRVFVSTYFSYMIFSKSVFNQNFHQPESDRSLIGIKLGYTF